MILVAITLYPERRGHACSGSQAVHEFGYQVRLCVLRLLFMASNLKSNDRDDIYIYAVTVHKKRKTVQRGSAQ